MTNKEIARNIAYNLGNRVCDDIKTYGYEDVYNAALQMAEWKDECFANMINKIVERANNIVKDCISAEDSETSDTIQKGFFTIDDFKEILEKQL